MVTVLKGLEFQGISLGQLLEKIVLHSFEPVPGQEGEQSWSPHGKKALDGHSRLSSREPTIMLEELENQVQADERAR